GPSLPPDLRAALAAADDEPVRVLPRPSRVAALAQLAPLRDGVAAARAAALAASHGMGDGIHCGAAHLGAAPHVALAARRAEDDEVGVEVADLADGGAAVEVDAPHLRGGERDERVLALAGGQDGARARAAHELRAAAGNELDRVDRQADGDVAEREAVAGLRLGGRAVGDDEPGLDAERGDDVALVAVLVVQEGDARGAGGGGLDRRDAGGDAVLVALPVDHAVLAAVAAAEVPHRDAPLVVAAAGLGQGLEEPRLGTLAPGEVGVVQERDLTRSVAGRSHAAD